MPSAKVKLTLAHKFTCKVSHSLCCITGCLLIPHTNIFNTILLGTYTNLNMNNTIKSWDLFCHRIILEGLWLQNLSSANLLQIKQRNYFRHKTLFSSESSVPLKYIIEFFVSSVIFQASLSFLSFSFIVFFGNRAFLPQRNTATTLKILSW